MQPRTVALVQAAGRVAFGAGLAAAPRLVGGAWVGTPADSAGGQVVLAAMGARDVAIGVGALRALTGRRGARAWVRAGMLADAADMVGTLRARAELPAVSVPLVAALAGASVGLGAWLQARVN